MVRWRASCPPQVENTTESERILSTPLYNNIIFSRYVVQGLPVITRLSHGSTALEELNSSSGTCDTPSAVARVPVAAFFFFYFSLVKRKLFSQLNTSQIFTFFDGHSKRNKRTLEIFNFSEKVYRNGSKG